MPKRSVPFSRHAFRLRSRLCQRVGIAAVVGSDEPLLSQGVHLMSAPGLLDHEWSFLEQEEEEPVSGTRVMDSVCEFCIFSAWLIVSGEVEGSRDRKSVV